MAVENLITEACFRDPAKARYQAIADELVQFIRSGQLPTGERLPPQRKLALKLKVTAGTVSRAYSVLEQQGLATARVGDGTYVRAVDSRAAGVADMQSGVTLDLAQNIAIPTDDGQALAAALQQLALEPDVLRQVLSYQPEAGLQRHREAGARWLQRFGMSGDWNRVMVTHGAQHGLSVVLRTLARPGDAVLTESLSYPGLQALARHMRLQLIGVEMDEQGMLPGALEHAARNIDAKLLYCSPSLHNPTNATMSMQRRLDIADVAARHHLMVMEDCVHAAALAQPLPALSSLLPDQSFLLSSFSKVMGPGLRVGYIEASSPWLSKFAAAMRADCWMVAPLLPEVASRWIDNGVVAQLVAAQCEEIAVRLQIAQSLMAGLEHRVAEGSPLIWLPLPEPWRADQCSSALRQAGVLVRTADHFAVGRTAAPQCLRISVNAAPSAEAFSQGMQILVSVLRGPPTGPMDP